MPIDYYFDLIFFVSAKLQEICGKHELYVRSTMSRAKVD